MKLLESQEKIKNLSVDDQIQSLYYKSRALERLGNFKEALKVALPSNELNNPGEKSLLLALPVAQLYALLKLGRLDEGLADNKKREQFFASLTPAEEKRGAHWIGLYKNVVGVIYHNKGEIDIALEFYQESLRLREQVKNPEDIAISLNNIGAVYEHRGEYNLALDYFRRSLSISESIDNPEGIAYALNNIGNVHTYLGEIDVALELFERSLVVKETIGNAYDISGTLHNLGAIYFNQGKDITRALEYFERSLELKNSIGNDLYTSSTLYDLINVYLDLKHSEKARTHLKRLEQLNNNRDNKVIHLFYRLAHAMILKQSKRMFDLSQAQHILTEISHENPIYLELTAKAMVHLCELLLFELKSIGELEVLVEARDLVDKLYKLAQKQNSHSLVVEVLILRAKFAIIGGELEVALKNLTKAQEIAEDKNLGLLLHKVEKEKNILESEYEKWQMLIDRNAPIQELLEQARLEEYAQEIQKIVDSAVVTRR